MKSYKIWILFILLSVVSFGEEFEDPNNNAIGIWMTSVGYDSSANILKMTFRSRTGEKFEEVDKLKLEDLQIINGLNDVYYTDVYAVRTDEISTSPKVITEWDVEIELGFALINDTITLNGTILVKDSVDGNQHAIDGRDIPFESFTIAPNDKTELKIYEKLNNKDNWSNKTTGITGSAITVDGYIFTKGGPGSLEEDPGVYALISTEEGAKIEKLKVTKNNGTEETLIVPYTEDSEAVIMKIGGFASNEINTITIIPVSIYGIEGGEVTLDFVTDTQINTLYLEGGIIGEIEKDVDGKKKIFVKLSELEELSGVKGYSYVFKVGNKPESDNESDLDGQSSTTLTENSITSTPKWEDGIVEIPTSGFIGGSKATLLFTVYDKLGHEKTFEKTYFIPKELDGITAKVSDEAKQRKSKIKVVTDGSSDKFELESSVDKSSE